MKCNVINVVIGIFMLVLTGCGGGGSAASSVSTETANSLITSVGWLYDNVAPDYSNNGPTCFLNVKVYYNESITAVDIDSFGVTAPNGWQWTIPASNSQSGTSSSGKPYIGGNIYYGADPHMMPLAGTWVFQLKLKNGQISSVQKTFHEPGSAADATHQYVYVEEDWTPSSNSSQYIAALGRFPEQGYTLQYSAANGGLITTTGLAAARTSFLAAQPHAYNMVCWLYDVNKTNLGYTITEFSPQDHSRTNLIAANGELSIVPASTVSPNGQLDLAAVKYLRFVHFDGAQYEPSSYSNADYRSISSLVAALVAITVSPSNAAIFKGSSQQFTASGTYTDGTVRDVTTSVTWITSNANLAVISNGAGTNGQVTALNDGTVTITASIGNISGSTTSTIWTLANSPTTNDMRGIAWSGTKLVAVGDLNTIITSSDGLNWISQPPVTYGYLFNAAWLGSHFAAVGQGGHIITSSDGVTWTLHASGTFNPLCGIAKSDAEYVAVGSVIVLSSPDESVWTSRSTDLTNSVCGIVWSGSRFVTVGYGGKILTSSDGFNWTSQASGTTNSLNGVAWSGTKYVAVGNTGTVLTSTDGVTWASTQSGISDQLYGIVWTGKQFITVGSNGSDYYGAGQVFASPDGITWTKIFGNSNSQSKALMAVTWMGNRIVATGNKGTILVSPVLE